MSALASAAGLDHVQLHRAIDRLVRLRLVRPDPIDGERFVPAPPDAALTALLHQRQAELAYIPVVAEQLVAAFRENSLRADPSGLLEIVRGQEAVADHFNALIQHASEELLVLDTPPYSRPLPEWEVRCEEALLRRGVRCRTVYAQASFDLPGRLEVVRRLVALGEHARVLPQLPVKLAIVDAYAALLPLSITPDAMLECAIVVYPSALLHALVALFDALWSHAAPLPANGPSPESQESVEVERMLFLLAAGLKDEAIARQLGVSPRTVRRRLTQLLELLGARTRFQAGLQAGKRGWL